MPKNIEIEESETPERKAIAQEGKDTSGGVSRGIIVVVGLAVIVGLSLLMALALGVFDIGDKGGQDSSEPAESAASSASGDEEAPPQSLSENAAGDGVMTDADIESAADVAPTVDLSPHGGDAGGQWAQSGVARTEGKGSIAADVSGVLGTWRCRDYDFDATTYTFQATFTDAGTFAVWLYDFEGGDDDRYAGIRTFTSEDGKVIDSGGFVFESRASDTLTLLVSEENKSHQQKSEYTFTRAGTEPETLKQLSWTVGEWYAQDDSGESYYLDMNGYWYEGTNEVSSGCWYILDGNVVLRGDSAAGTQDSVLVFMGSEYNVLVNLETRQMFGWEPPAQGALAASAA